MERIYREAKAIFRPESREPYETDRAADRFAFDAAAPEYDQSFTHRALGRWLREPVWQALGRIFQPGDRVLELGCGTGEDAIWLARRGVLVTATDVSTEMMAVAQHKAANLGLSEQISWHAWDLSNLGKGSAHGASPLPYSGLYGGALANFGVLNCLADRRPLAENLAQQMQPGGRLLLVIMAPFCPWEILWYLAHGQIRAAFRRFHAGKLAHTGGGAWLPVWYPAPARVKREFAPWFRMIRLRGIGVCLPPSYLAHLVERWPALFTRLRGVEERVAHNWWAARASDHYMIEFERVD
ncbi:MAG: class I SAM-dependent methyltransferase [Chloroflexi bacterium]|nr:class I SAM-dependent methyltransferase [Chloroflexota bacterium]